MKKLMILALMALVGLLGACRGTAEGTVYSDDEPFILDMKGNTLKILQLTDLHLISLWSANTKKTFGVVEKLVKSDDYDLIIFTGDTMVTANATAMFDKLIVLMESLEIPWTFTFGNHETDQHDYQDFLDRITETEYLVFKAGPQLEKGGVGNFRIQFTKDGNPFYMIYLFDSHTYREDDTVEEGEYGYVRPSQVEWYEGHVAEDAVDSIAFMHIPLRQFIVPTDYVGNFGEDVCPQGVDGGLFDAMVAGGKTKGVFVGHDHLNDYSFSMDGIYLAYGRITGYDAYGNLERGGRVIEVDAAGTMTSFLLPESEVPAQ